jgi:hypothetical protein
VLINNIFKNMIFNDKKVSFSAVIVSLVLVLCFFAGFYVLAQFYVPLDTSPNSQTKEGGLILNSTGAAGSNGLIIKNGNVGIGVDSASAQLDVGGAGTLRLAPQALPPSGAQGSIYYDSNLNILKYFNGSSWQTLAGSGTPTIPSGTIGGTYELYYWQDGRDPSSYVPGCRASWGQANCGLASWTNKCNSGYHSQIMAYGYDSTGPYEYPGGWGVVIAWHTELYGCIKD